jgi:hypothetical protein
MHLELPLSTFEDIDRVITMFVIRAASQIQSHTRDVTIIDTPAPAEALPARKAQHSRSGLYGKPTVTEKDHTIYVIISLIPDGRLRTFRYVMATPAVPHLTYVDTYLPAPYLTGAIPSTVSK